MGLGGKGQDLRERSLRCAELTTSWTPCSRSSSAVTQIFGFYWGREGIVTSPPGPAFFPSSFIHQFYPHLPSHAAGCQQSCCPPPPGFTAGEHPLRGGGGLPKWLPV